MSRESTVDILLHDKSVVRVKRNDSITPAIDILAVIFHHIMKEKSAFCKKILNRYILRKVSYYNLSQIKAMFFNLGIVAP